MAPKVLVRGRRWAISRRNSKGVALLLKGIGLHVGSAVDVKAVGLHLTGLAFTLRLHELAFDADARAGCDRLKFLVGELGHVKHNLNILYGRTVIELHELYMLVAAAGTHPAFGLYLGTYERGVFEQVDYFGLFHLQYLR